MSPVMVVTCHSPNIAGNGVKKRMRGEDEWHSDERSRGLSHHSTGIDAGGLDFRVRDGTGYYPSAVAVHTTPSNVMNREAYWTEAHLWLGCKKLSRLLGGLVQLG